MNRRHDSYEDYAKEIDEQAEKKAHEEGECAEWCPYCADDEEQMSKDVDELVDHLNKEVLTVEKK